MGGNTSVLAKHRLAEFLPSATSRSTAVHRVAPDANLQAMLNLCFSKHADAVWVGDGLQYGLLSCFDVVKWLIEERKKNKEFDASAMLHGRTCAEAFAAAGVQTVRLPATARLDTALSTMLAQHLHRIAVTNDDETDVIALVHQKKLLKFLLARIVKESRHTFSINVRQANLVRPNAVVYSCSESAPVLDAFQSMIEHGVHTLAVLDANGSLCGSLAVSQIRGLTPKQTDQLSTMTVRSFLLAVGSKMPGLVTPYTSIETSLAAMTSQPHAHFAFVVDGRLDARCAHCGPIPSALVTNPDGHCAVCGGRQSSLATLPSSLKLLDIITMTDVLRLFEVGQPLHDVLAGVDPHVPRKGNSLLSFPMTSPRKK